MSLPPPLKEKKRFTVEKGDSIIHIKADGTIDIYPYLPVGEKVGIATTTAFAMYWAMMDDEYRIKLCKRAKLRLEEIMAGREADI